MGVDPNLHELRELLAGMGGDYWADNLDEEGWWSGQSSKNPPRPIVDVEITGEVL